MPTTDPYTRDPAILFARRLASDTRAFDGARARLCEALEDLSLSVLVHHLRHASPGDDLDETLLNIRRELRQLRDAANASADIQAPTPYTSALRLCGDLFAAAPGAVL